MIWVMIIYFTNNLKTGLTMDVFWICLTVRAREETLTR